MTNPNDDPKSIASIVDILQSVAEKEGGIFRDPAPPACPICHGIGSVSPVYTDGDGNEIKLRVGDPRFGKYLPCPDPRHESERTNRAGASSGLAPAQLQMTWKTLTAYEQQAEARKAIIGTMKRGYGWVYLHSTPGYGKSALLRVAVAEAIRAGMSAKYIELGEYFSYLREGIHDDGIEARVGKIERYDLLAFDEVDKEIAPSDWVTKQLQRIMSSRYRTSEDMKTITLFGANSPPAAFSGYIASRMRDRDNEVVRLGIFIKDKDGKIIEDKGVDFRQKAKKDR